MGTERHTIRPVPFILLGIIGLSFRKMWYYSKVVNMTHDYLWL
ncbi:hypothetical protein ATG71_1331 [Bacillus sp. es.034]|nr:hypothetical protein ATG71_1331 [Bacillus sp. es.034]